jgi:8-oxo-dGTP pyrophosphatase MutT (NUDIX family)
MNEHEKARSYVSLVDRCYQLALWCAFQILRAVWFVRRPSQHGALALIWFEGRVLLVRNSYQPRWSAPGGSVEEFENALDAVVREIAEEIRLRVDSKEVKFVRDVTFHFRNRRDRVSLFEWYPLEMPIIELDNREIIDARWFTLNETKQLFLPPHLVDYFLKFRDRFDVDL